MSKSANSSTQLSFDRPVLVSITAGFVFQVLAVQLLVNLFFLLFRDVINYEFFYAFYDAATGRRLISFLDPFSHFVHNSVIAVICHY